MVLAFIIQTLGPEEPEVAYYRFYSTWTDLNSKTMSSSNTQDNLCVFESSTEKKDLLSIIMKKVHMLYSLKIKQSLIPIQSQDSKTLIKGHFIERNWKETKFCIIWEGVSDIGFSLVCGTEENIIHAQNILDTIVSQLEKYLQLLSYPSVTTKTLDTLALILDHFLPGGNLLFFNSSVMKNLEKQLETNLKP